MVAFKLAALTVAAGLSGLAGAQTYQRLGGCPTLGCVFPPDQADFLAGQYFDVRLEVHAPVNGSERINRAPDTDFKFTIKKKGTSDRPENAASFFQVKEPALERWNFTWFEDLFAQDAGTPSLVNVTAKAYRKVALYEAGEYEATLSYYNGTKTTATWTVRDLEDVRKTKNILFFIGDGMTTNMITAARLIAHKSVNGKYKSLMQMDKFPVLGHQMTHSMDSYITDSANSATTLYSGHKTTVNCLGVYRDSSPSVFDDPKIESIAEIFHRLTGGGVGIVSTAFLADATPAGLTAHTRDRFQYPAVVESFLNGVTANYTWTNWTGPDVLFGGGAEQFFNSSKGPVGNSYKDQDYYNLFQKAGYQLALDNTALGGLKNDQRALGVFSTGVMAKWLDRNVYTGNLQGPKNSPDGNNGSATNQPGLKEMTLKAIDILNTRSGNKGWFLMSEAASIDKQMHLLDYDRALGELLELDDTIRASIEKLKQLNTLKETLVLVTADHGHGFDVAGSVDTQYLAAQTNDRSKRKAVGVYAESGLSQYINTGNLQYGDGIHFPSNWDPRYTLFQGVMATPDHRENFTVHRYGPRLPATSARGANNYYVNPADATNGFVLNGTLPVSESQGVHSLTDVPVFAMGPEDCQNNFRGVYNSPDIFFGMADCLGLSRWEPEGGNGHGHGHGGYGGH